VPTLVQKAHEHDNAASFFRKPLAKTGMTFLKVMVVKAFDLVYVSPFQVIGDVASHA
jgi:hypothetical protein